MRLDPEHELSSAAIAALDGLLQGEAEPERASDEALLSLLRGDLGLEDREGLTRLVVRSAASRRRLVELHRETARLLRLPVEQWDDKARTALYLEPARELLNVVSELSPAHWDLVVESDELRFSSVRATLRAIVGNARAALAAPRFSAARGGPSALSRLYAEVEASGTLLAQATPAEPWADGRSAVLELVDPLGGGFPVAEAALQDGRWSFHAAGFGPTTDLPEGPLPSALFRVVADAVGPRERDPGFLWAEDDEGLLIAVETMRPPRVFQGTLTLVVRLPKAVREAHGRERLLVSLPLGRHAPILGAWPVSEIRDVATLSANVYGLPDGDLTLGSTLKARLTSEGMPDA